MTLETYLRCLDMHLIRELRRSTTSSRTSYSVSSSCEPHYENEAKCKAFHFKMSFVCIRMKSYFHNKNLAPRFRKAQSNSEMAYIEWR